MTGQGQVYHCGNCIHLEDLAKVYKIPLAFAKWMDYPPCGDCEPDKNVQQGGLSDILRNFRAKL